MSNNSKNFKDTELSEKIRLTNGQDKSKAFFRNLAYNDRERAVNLINDENLEFSTLFILQPEIIKSDLSERLNERNKLALELVNKILTRRSLNNERISSNYDTNNYNLYKWICETAYAHDGLNDRYDEVIEAVSIILAKVYKDKEVLPVMLDMIFNRYKKGDFIYDLVWAFFECSEPESLIMIAERLRSDDWKEVELARKLLSFIPLISRSSINDKSKQYLGCINWINENKHYMYYTGESFQQTFNPCPYTVSLESKYLHKTGQSRDISSSESNLLDAFNVLDEECKLILSDFSVKLYRQNINWWNKWHRCPVPKQLAIAKQIGGLS